MRLFLVACLALLFTQCHLSGKPDNASARAAALVEVLADNNLYLPDSVNAALKKVDAQAPIQSKKIFLKAVDQFHNKKDAAGSIALFRKAIRMNPEPKAYYELGNALLSIKDYQQSADAFRLAVKLNFTPLANCYFNLSTAYCMLGDTVKAITQLRNALEEGYADKTRLTNDSNWDYLRTTPGFLAAITDYFKGAVNPAQARYRIFLKVFPEMDSTFTIDRGQASEYSLGKSISYDFADYIPGMEDPQFSRNVSSEYLAICKRKLSSGYTLVVYTTVVAISDTLPPVETNFAVYDSTGKQVSLQLFSSSDGPSKIVTGSFNSKNELLITEYHEEWQSDPTTAGYEGNKIVKETVVERQFLQLSERGEFIPKAIPETVSSRK